MPVAADFACLDGFVSRLEFEGIRPAILAARGVLSAGGGDGKEYLGWLHPRRLNEPGEIERLKRCAKRLSESSEAVLCVGIGGSYLGARAAVEYLVSPFYNSLPKKTPDLWFVGNSLSASQLADALAACENKRVSVVVISKSGTTTEPAVAFRVLRDVLRRRLGDGAAARVVAITDRKRGALRAVADAEGYETFVIPDDVGGRFSVLTPVGLLPVALSGADVDALLSGASDAADALARQDFWQNPCLLYAAARNLLYKKGRTVELFCGWDPCFAMTAEWLRQLFGESEGKDRKGLFPASASFSADLHSLGQFIQQGSPVLFETVLSVAQDKAALRVPDDPGNGDGLDYVAGMELGEMAKRARRAVALAHREGGTPSILLETPSRTAYEYGWMLYFFEYACAVGAYTLGVNPFDQPGVERYKQNLFALLGKPGFEQTARLLCEDQPLTPVFGNTNIEEELL